MYKTWMMKTLLLSTSLGMLSACNEKIAPELADPAASATTAGTGGGGSPTPTTSTNSFKLELGNSATNNIAPEILGYTLHKANELATVECQIDDVTDVPDTLDSTRDITCFMEAEEYALYFNGYKINATSDAGTCNYISATPYTYYQYQPGVSARMDGSPREVVKFNCSETAKQLHGAAVLHTDATSSFGANASGSTTVTQLCGKYVNIDGTTAVSYGTLDLSATTSPVTLVSDEDLCSFNYQDEGVNCDEGQVRVHTVSVDNLLVGAVNTLTATDASSELIDCGGKVKNCIGGAAPQIVGETAFKDQGKILRIAQIPAEGGSNTAISLAADLSRESNFYFSNFMRQCSGMPNFTTAANFNTGSVFSPGFDPDVMEEYARLGTTLPPATQEKDALHGQFDVITLADDPFRAGIPDADIAIGDLRENWSNFHIQARPFHSFECLDQALDVKARIRLVVREWNRNFSPTTQEFRYISDVFSATAKMDAGSAQTNNYLVYDQFNDVADWDDQLFFSNSPTNSCVNSNMIDDGPGGLPGPRSSLWFPGEDN